MAGSARSRDIAKAAIRAELAQVARELFTRDGFDQVTVTELAAAAGVSRSTFLRYLASKEEAVLAAFDDQGEQLANALRARPAGEDDWTALRRALESLLGHYRADETGARALATLVQQTPALRARSLEKQAGWRSALAAAIAERGGDPGGLRPAVLAAVAIDCLNIAVDQWTSHGASLDALLDEAFSVFTPAGTRRGG